MVQIQLMMMMICGWPLDSCLVCPGTIQVLLQAALGLHQHATDRGQDTVGQWLEPLVALTLMDNCTNGHNNTCRKKLLD